MLENGADIRVIQEMLGHAKLTTTELYTRVSINLLKQVYLATHPAANLKPHASTLLVPILNARTIAGFVSGKVADRGAGDTQIHRRRQYADVARLGNAAMTAGTVVSR